MKQWLPLCLLVLIVGCIPIAISRADELTDTTNTLMQKQDELKRAQDALQQAKNQVQALAGDMPSLQSSLNIAIAEVNVKQAQLDATSAELDRRSALLHQQQINRQERIRELYKQYKKDAISPMLQLLDANDFRTWTRMVSYHQIAMDDDKNRITSLDDEVAKLNKEKADLQAQANQLKQQKAQFQTQVDNLRYQIAHAQYQQNSANSQIANLNKDIKGLSAKQQQILAAKAAANAVNTSIGDVAPTSSPPPPPAFSGSAFAFASYGVPHRVGMNQYGAYGRANAGQNFSQILNAYFNNVSVSVQPEPDTINVQGFGTMSFEDMYLLGIHEMPRSWSLEALKAQAVVARTYAVKWLNDHPGGAICTTQTCQVYHNDDPNSTDQYDQRWYQAVRETRGVIITQGGAPIGAYFASTAGGITQQSGQVWNVDLPYLKIMEDCNGSWPNNCYDSISPWFHKPWGDYNGKSETSTGTNCPTCNPWLTKSDTIHLLNAAIALQNSNNDASSVSADLSTFTEPIHDFGDIAFSQNKGTGQTDAAIVIGTNQGTINIKGSSVKAAVNLKAPGTIMIQTTLFDVIKQ